MIHIKYHFIVTLCPVRSQEILEAIKEETSHQDHSKYGMFFLCLMSHGCEDEVVLGSDQVGVKLKDIYSLLAASKFPLMKGKPKVVVIQACAGGKILWG